MRRILLVLAVAAVAVVAIVLLKGGGASSNDDKQVRSTLSAYAQASARKDYATICKRYLAQNLLDQLRQIKLPCRSALAKGLGGVRSPTLTVKSVKVTGATALVEVHTAAANQPPLDGTIELVKADGLWRIRSLAEQQKTKTTP